MKRLYFFVLLLLLNGCFDRVLSDDVFEITKAKSPPIILLIGSPIIDIELGVGFVDPGFTATDLDDGDLTSLVIVSGTVDTSITGAYPITYTVIDSDGNSISITRTVVVSLDIPPVITLTGSPTINITLGDDFTDPGATAKDNKDGDLTASLTTSGTVDTSNVGTYSIVYSVSDSGGNSTSLIRTVIVGEALIYFETGTCKCPLASIGQTQTINGIVYIVVDNNSLRSQVTNANYNLCTTLVTDMNGLFEDNSSFNSSISFWDTSNVISMIGMFKNANTFNQDIGGWNTSKVTNNNSMFENATLFNQDIGNWDTSSIINMQNIFYNANSFNQDIGAWDTSSVMSLGYMFRKATSFNQDIGNWNTSNVINMYSLFDGAELFDQDIGGWDTSNVASMRFLFRGATAFNKNIGAWNTSSSNIMTGMFFNASSFNQDISSWCVKNFVSKPRDFSINSPLTEENSPLWGGGTCLD
tara:strand:+ start:1834 stop:3243 length:1410 start_codon:yes stop_codon:yes gene_type:complete